ncbi:amino acid adenylation domain-containing protein [Legionella nautarum]|uniref:amino acid adenylation domain-containing protein n=1 Tax=Legionella nautarum TaxID=45070 RepID=UPI00138F4AAF|nr:amino acid adenylation domain-containing protein [Legionella nautarum]
MIKAIDELDFDKTPQVDYIFSIVNSHLLSSSFLKLARKHVINYHDSLLPDYAGLNATSWALVNGERQHGITWHIVNEQIDEGDILIQRSFPIENNATALSLNLRCYELAIDSFSELLHSLQSESYVTQSQSLANRRYFSATHLLPELGFINWQTMSADFIVRLHHALLLGHYKNNIGLLKIYLGQDFLIVLDAQLINKPADRKNPGTILNVSLGEMQISTCQGIVNLHFKLPSARKITTEIIATYNLLPGIELPSLPENLMALHTKSYKDALTHEGFWIKQLQSSTEHKHYASFSHQEREFEQAVSVLQLNQLPLNSAIKDLFILLLTSFLIYFFRLNNYEKTSLHLIPNTRSSSQKNLPSLFPSFLPFNWPELDEAYSLEKMMKRVEKKYQKLLLHVGYLGDIFLRQPELEDYVAPSIAISFSPIELYRLPSSITIYIQVDEIKGNIHSYHRLDEEHNKTELQSFRYFNSHISKIIEILINSPKTPINEFCFLSASEINILNELATGKTYPLPPDSLTTLFEKKVNELPHATALLMNNKAISYLQLWQMAEIIADLVRTTVPAQTFIGLYTSRNPIMLAMIFGILKADCVYVPLDIKYPLGKIELIASRAKLDLIFTTSEFTQPLIDFFKTQSLSIIDIEKLLDNKTQSLKTFNTPILRPAENRLAYIMFTSGTTGEPKGVIISQNNVINYCFWFMETTQFNAESVIDFSSSIAFDLSVPCTIAPLLAGGTIAICTEEEKFNPKLYLAHLLRYRVTHTELTPGYVELLLNHPEMIQNLSQLRYLLLGADTVHTNEVNHWLSLCPHTQIVNEYGPTEATVSVTSYFVTPHSPLHTATIPIGKPAFNSFCYVLDKFNNLCPFGMKGELHVAGNQIALGYLEKPQITAQKFISLCFNDKDSIRAYKTGDEVCWNADGQLQFFGRNDFQIKLHGYRIELSAIEALLMQQDSIHQAVVRLKKQNKEKSLCAYLVAKPNKTIVLDELQHYLANYLPSYMLPKDFFLVKSIPLKENEKIDLERLENEMDKQLIAPPTMPYNSLTSTQEYCLKTWQNVFKKTVLIEDNFFDLGGDSLIALQIITVLKAHYSIPLSLSCLFESPTILSLSAQIDRLLKQHSPQKLILNYSNTLIKLSTGSYPTPLFLVHPVGGSIFWYQQLAKQLEGKYTVYGIQDPNLEEEQFKFQNIEEMAAFYLQAISSVYQGNQFCLGGASFGATVAFEMAYQLQQAGFSIPFLGLLDGWAHYPSSLMKEDSLNLISQNNQYITEEQRLRLLSQEEYRKKLLNQYAIPTLSANVLLFKAQKLWKSFAEINDTYNGWQSYVHGKITVHLVPGDHESMFFHPNIEKWAHLFFTI